MFVYLPIYDMCNHGVHEHVENKQPHKHCVQVTSPEDIISSCHFAVAQIKHFKDSNKHVLHWTSCWLRADPWDVILRNM